MRAPPPKVKGVVTIEQIVDMLPDRGRSCWHLGAVWALSQFQDNEVRPEAFSPLPGVRRFNPLLNPRVLWFRAQAGPLLARNPDLQGWRGPRSPQGQAWLELSVGRAGELGDTGTLPTRAPPTPAIDKAPSCGFLPSTPVVGLRVSWVSSETFPRTYNLPKLIPKPALGRHSPTVSAHGCSE